jgi:glyoxylase-like metal-dependent hydrolase (beta-lactamase superfamily II)
MSRIPSLALSRRHFLARACLGTAALWLSPRRLFAGEGNQVATIRKAALHARITLTKLRGNVSLLEGSGGNIAVLTGRDGKLLVDAGIPGSRQELSAALASLGAEPIKHLIDSHWHFDHTDGNEWLHAEGAEITAHENTHKHLSAATRVEGWNYTFPASPAGALPTKLFADELKLEVNDSKIHLKYYQPAHTDSDIAVHFAEADILHVADTF